MAIRVLVADDHAVIRAGIRAMLQPEPMIEVVGEAGDGEQAIKLVDELSPDILLLDIQMSKLDGIQTARQVKKTRPNVGVIFLTDHAEDEYVAACVKAGADGYLLRGVSHEELVETIQAVARGESMMHPAILRKVLDTFANLTQTGMVAHNRLTPRELEVLQEIGLGLNNREIAEKLCITEKTVKTHITSIFSKLNFADRSQAIIYAIKHGLVDIYREVG